MITLLIIYKYRIESFQLYPICFLEIVSFES